MWVLCVEACHPAQTPSASLPSAPSQSERATTPAPVGGPAQCPNDASADEWQFCQAALRAVHATDEDDSDDATPLLALLDALETQSALWRLDGAWRARLHVALTRAQTLAQLARPLRQLRRAVLDAYMDPRTGLYRGVDTTSCRDAFVAFALSDVDWQELQVTVEPLGTYSLSALRRFCLESRTLDDAR